MGRFSDLYARWSLELRPAGLFNAGERVGVAVSGGPDSVLLLDFMVRLARERGLSLTVVHFNHRLRAAESDADEKFVQALANQQGLEFIRGEADVAGVARERRANLEATARDLRYRFFFSLINQGRLDQVATAHTANDQAETVLLKLLRGAGTRGLAGVSPVLEGRIVRPFLGLARREVEEELRRRGLKYRTDSTNLAPGPRRNKVRMELLPMIERDYNPDVVRTLKALADRACDDETYLEQQAREAARAWRVREGSGERIAIRALLEFPRAIARRVLRQMFRAVSGAAGGITHAHLGALLEFSAEAQSGRTLALPAGLEARKEFDWLEIGPVAQATTVDGYSYRVEVPGRVFVPELNTTFDFKIVGSEAPRASYNLNGVAGLDPAKLPGQLVLRNWQSGDRFRPGGSRNALKLKELFRRRRIPQTKRKLWPVLECGKEIVWVRDFPPGAAAAALPEAREVLIVTEGVPTLR